MSRKKIIKTSSKRGQSRSFDDDDELSIFVNNIGVNPKVLPARTCGKAARRKAKLAKQNLRDQIEDNLENTIQEIDSTHKSMQNKEDFFKQINKIFVETEKKIEKEFDESNERIRQIHAGNRLLQTDGESKSSKNTQSPTSCAGIENTSVEAENDYRKYINSLTDLVYDLKHEIKRLKDENFKLNEKISEMSQIRQENSEYNTKNKSDKIPCDACDKKQKIIDRGEESLKKMQNLLNDKTVLCDKECREYSTKITLLEERNEELKKMCDDAQREKFISECQNLEHINVLLDLERRSHDMLESSLKEEIFKLQTKCASLRESVDIVMEELRRNHNIILELQYKNIELSQLSHFSRNILYYPYGLVS